MGSIIASDQHNVKLALTKMKVSLAFNLFTRQNLVHGVAGLGPVLDDDAVRRIWFEIQERFRFKPKKDFFWDAILDLARREAFHPVCDYFERLQWDGSPRLDNWLTNYGGAHDSPYTSAVGAIVMIAAVRRVRQPGVKFDEMMVLEGPQGSGKSSALACLAGDRDWFTDQCPFNAEGREVIEALSGRLIVEAGELAGLRKAGAENLKSFLSRTVDHGRAAYARIAQAVPRQCVIIGTTNNAAY